MLENMKNDSPGSENQSEEENKTEFSGGHKHLESRDSITDLFKNNTNKETAKKLFFAILERVPVNELTEEVVNRSQGKQETITLVFEDKKITLDCQTQYVDEKGVKSSDQAPTTVHQITKIIEKNGEPIKIEVLVQSWDLAIPFSDEEDEGWEESSNGSFDFEEVKQEIFQRRASVD